MISIALIGLACFAVYLVMGLLAILLNNHIDGKKNGTYYYSRESDILLLIFWPAAGILLGLLLACIGVEYLFTGKSTTALHLSAKTSKKRGIYGKDKLDAYAAKKTGA